MRYKILGVRGSADLYFGVVLWNIVLLVAMNILLFCLEDGVRMFPETLVITYQKSVMLMLLHAGMEMALQS
jgi:hypothetical protein